MGRQQGLNSRASILVWAALAIHHGSCTASLVAVFLQVSEVGAIMALWFVTAVPVLESILGPGWGLCH